MCWCNVAGTQQPVQKSAALPTARSWEEKGHLGSPCSFYLPSPAELQQPPVRPAHMETLTGCLCHLLFPAGHPQSPPQPGDHNPVSCTQRGSAPREPQDRVPPCSNLCPSHHQWLLGHMDPRLRKEGSLNNAFQLSLEGNKAHPTSSLQQPAGASPHIGQAHHGPTLDHPRQMLCCCFVTTYLFID